MALCLLSAALDDLSSAVPVGRRRGGPCDLVLNRIGVGLVEKLRMKAAGGAG